MTHTKLSRVIGDKEPTYKCPSPFSSVVRVGKEPSLMVAYHISIVGRTSSWLMSMGYFDAIINHYQNHKFLSLTEEPEIKKLDDA